ncbi:MAG: hypothetical protein WC556_08000 [Candidatus Methanoperedens sp.]
MVVNKKGNNSDMRDMVRIPLIIEIPRPYYELWQGAKIAHSLDDGFLNYFSGKSICMLLKTLMTFGE